MRAGACGDSHPDDGAEGGARVTRSTVREDKHVVREDEDGVRGDGSCCSPTGGNVHLEDDSRLRPWEDAKVLQFHPARFHGWNCSDAVSTLVATFGEKKLALMEKIGLGGLVHVKPVMAHSKSLLLWVYKRIDTAKMRVIMGDGRFMPLSAKSVERMLGIRGTGSAVEEEEDGVSNQLKLRLHKMFGTADAGKLPCVGELQQVLLKDYSNEMSAEDEGRFSIALAAFCCAHMLGANSRGAVIPKNIWKFISSTDNLERCNWGEYVVRCVVRSAKEVQKHLQQDNAPFSVKLGGCWLYLEVKLTFGG